MDNRSYSTVIFQSTSVQSSEGGPGLVEMLNRLSGLDPYQEQQSACVGGAGHMLDLTSNGIHHELPISHSSSGTSELGQGLIVELSSDISQQGDSVGKKGRPGRPKVRPTKDRQAWHYHLGGVRHCRVPLTPEIREALEVAYISRIMSKNFRKEGQPEKERLARITGMDLDKIQEWFKNRRKKDKLISERQQGKKLPRGRRGRKSASRTNQDDLAQAETVAALPESST